MAGGAAHLPNMTDGASHLPTMAGGAAHLLPPRLLPGIVAAPYMEAAPYVSHLPMWQLLRM